MVLHSCLSFHSRHYIANVWVRDIFLYGGWSIDVRLVLIVNPIFDLSGATLSIIETVFPGHARGISCALGFG